MLMICLILAAGVYAAIVLWPARTGEKTNKEMEMTNMLESPIDTALGTPDPRPGAVGLVRPELSGTDTAAHALGIQCHAHHLGYRWIYTVRPPQGTRDPVGYTLGIAASMDAAAIVTVDTTHLDGRPELVNNSLDLVTLTPPRLWHTGSPEPITVPSAPPYDCTWDPSQLEPDCARRLWRTHRDCLPDCRARLAAGAALSAQDEVD